MPEITANGIAPSNSVQRSQKLLGITNNNNNTNNIIIADFTINDILATLLGGIIISKLYNISIIKSVLGLFLVLEFLHLVFGINTALVPDLISEL